MDVDTDVLVVIPAFNEASTVGAVVAEVLESVPKAQVLVVDGRGSTDTTGPVARRAGASVIRNVFNLGVGGAMPGRVSATPSSTTFGAVVQVDADGQHDARDLGAAARRAVRDIPEPMVVIAGPASPVPVC